MPWDFFFCLHVAKMCVCIILLPLDTQKNDEGKDFTTFSYQYYSTATTTTTTTIIQIIWIINSRKKIVVMHLLLKIMPNLENRILFFSTR